MNKLNVVTRGHRDHVPLHWPNFNLGGPVLKKLHIRRQQNSMMTASKTTAPPSPTPKLPSELLHPDKPLQSLWNLPGTIGIQGDRACIRPFSQNYCSRYHLHHTSQLERSKPNLDHLIFSRVQWTLGMTRPTKVADAVEAGEGTANGEDRCRERWQQQRPRKIFSAVDSGDNTTIKDTHCQGRWQWQLPTEMAATMDAGDRLAVTVFKIKNVQHNNHLPH